MTAYRDHRTGDWRYRKWVVLPNGTRRRITGTPATDTKAAAEDAERLHIVRVLHPESVESEAPAANTKETPTIKTFSEEFMTSYRPEQKPSERYSKKSAFRSLLPFFGHLRLDEVDQIAINRYATTRLKTVAPKTLNNQLAVFSTMLDYAHTNGIIAKHGLRMHVDATDAEVHAVPGDDVKKMLGVVKDQRYRVAILLAAEAGLRIGEIRGLQWTDLKGGRLTVRRAIDQRNNVGSPKHNKVRTVPLSASLITALDALPKRGIWVLTPLDGDKHLSYWTMLESVQSVYDKAGVKVPVAESGKTMPWHSLRHTFGTELAAQSVPIPTIGRLMGHADVATTMRYVTVTGGQMDEAIALVFGAPAAPILGQRVGNRAARPSRRS